ncbi:TPA: DNA cytosine methyltransferase [Citrobacter freundii]|nr:DNA cytosine methyltransferase [Citrobacter freundii]HBZ9023746.1 DNA cytosine methyltransferase [Citrobacter freundii]HCA0567272.1 DNA cytosine methyltransferase [Citrobacter freundii]HCA0665315.1 DNA cytosine methyltransferase [Citrobacter freundii]HCA0670663.1 DNA cytosine methyltransferase [Citrobacter freundii]
MTITYGSVCSGIEAASVAWECLGWQPEWFAQFDPEHDYSRGPDFPSAVLDYHWPDVPNLGDMTKIAATVSAGITPAPDIIVGGTPCQDFSVAGARAGLSGSRGQLTISYGELADAVDDRRTTEGKEPAIFVWENVPGVLSSKDNAFGAFLGLLAGEDCRLQPPGKRWANAGYVRGPKRAIAWRILDAQYFGVAQRRRRVFVITSARGDINPAKILFESDGVRRDIAPSREAGEKSSFTIGGGFKVGSHWDNLANPHPTLNQSHNTGGIGASNQELFSQRGSGLVCIGLDEEQNAGIELFGTLKSREKGGGFEGTVVYPRHYTFRMTAFGEYADDETASTVKARDYKDATDLAVDQSLAVRRLTPLECEHLQGFPDNHTLIPVSVRKKITAEEYAYLRHRNPALTAEEAYRLAKDGPRYKALGNSMAVPVMRWIGQRIANAVREADACIA